MEQLNQTKELMGIIASQKPKFIPAGLADDAAKNLQSSRPNTARAEYVINQFKDAEKHPALAAKLKSAEKEIAAFKLQQKEQKQGVKR